MGEQKMLRRKLIDDTFWGFVAVMINRVGSLFLTVILARFFLPRNYGLYSLVLSTALLFYVLADLGINKALVRYLSHSLAYEKKKIKSYYTYFRRLKLLMSVGASLLLLVFAWPISHLFFKNTELFYPLLVSAMYIFILTLEEFYAQIFFIVEKIKYSAMKESINFILRAIFIFIVFYLISKEFQIFGIFAFFSIAAFFVFLFNFFLSKKLLPEFDGKDVGSIDKKKILAFVGYLSIASISTVLFSHVDSIMLGFFIGPEFVGYYRVAFSLVFGVLGFVAFPNVFLLPVFTKLEKSETEKVFAHSFRYMSLLTIPMITGILLVGRYFISIFYGELYLPGVNSLYILSLIIFPAMGVGLLLSLFSSKERPKIFAVLIVLTGVLNIFLNFVLIKLFLRYSPELGILGASIATTISWYFYFIFSFYAAKRKLKYSLSFPDLLRPIFSSAIMAGILWVLFNKIQNMNLALGLIEIILGAAIYFVVMILIGGLTKQDLEIVKMGFRR
jgi:O-antigen/teichoic acid export membrane protein